MNALFLSVIKIKVPENKELVLQTQRITKSAEKNDQVKLKRPVT